MAFKKAAIRLHLKVLFQKAKSFGNPECPVELYPGGIGNKTAI